MGVQAAYEPKEWNADPMIAGLDYDLDEHQPYLASADSINLTNLRLGFGTKGKGSTIHESPTLPIVSPTASKRQRKKSSYLTRRAWPTTINTLRSKLPGVSSNPEWSPWESQFVWLALYFTLNLLLTLSNKSVLTGFPFPYSLTALHTLCSAVGGLVLRWQGVYIPKSLTRREEYSLAMFSLLYGLNVAVSNVSLNLVTVPFHQVVRAVTPIFTLILSAILLGTHVNKASVVSLAPVIIGVIFATYGDYYFTLWGLVLTLVGTVLAALKTIFTNVLQSPPNHHKPHHPTLESRLSQSMGISTILSALRQLVPPRLDIHPLDLLTRMSPLAFVQCMVYAHLSGELSRIRSFGVHPPSATDIPSISHASLYDCLHAIEIDIVGGVAPSHMLVLLLNGCIAFGLNVVSFSANGKVGPLSMTVAANVKQVLTILCAVSMFNLTITPMNALGITTTLFGGAWYAFTEYTSKRRGRKSQS
ncbi:TPT-domain-containing protein [Trametopsis cervina]|nr:TPT-domain-containing protein [Trametopsis cervina]